MKSISLTIFFLLLVNVSFSQEKFLIDLKPDQFSIPNRTFYIDSVIDNRLNKEGIGVIQKGANNRQVPADFSIGFVPALGNYFRAIVGKGNDNNLRHLIAVIEDFAISEKTYRLKETGFADLTIAFCELDSGRLRKVYIVSEHQESGGNDVTDDHLTRILSCLHGCLQKLTSSGFENQITKNYMILSKEWNPYGEGSILTVPTFQKGIYKNLNELRTNSPSIGTEFKSVPKNDLFELRNLSTDEKMNEPYGFCDGKDIYITTFFYQTNRNGIYAKVIQKGRYLVWLDHYISPMAGAFVGPIARKAIYSELSCIGMDIKTGVITPLDRKNLRKIMSNDPDLLLKVNKLDNIGLVDTINLMKEFNARHKD